MSSKFQIGQRYEMNLFIVYCRSSVLPAKWLSLQINTFQIKEKIDTRMNTQTVPKLFLSFGSTLPLNFMVASWFDIVPMWSTSSTHHGFQNNQDVNPSSDYYKRDRILFLL